MSDQKPHITASEPDHILEQVQKKRADAPAAARPAQSSDADLDAILSELGVGTGKKRAPVEPILLPVPEFAHEKNDPLPEIPQWDTLLISSYCQAVALDGRDPVIIGERINPTGKKKLQTALREGDMGYVLGEVFQQEEAGAHILDVNVGLPGLDEPAVLTQTVEAIQEVTGLPLQLDTSNPAAMEAALRRYNGKPLVNSVNGKEESLETILPLVKKYGVVPHEAQAETHCTNNTAELNTVLSHLLRQDALKLRTMAQEDKDTKAAQEEMLNEVYRVLAVCFGEPVQKFDFTYNDAKGHYHADLGITPLEFLKKYEAEHA